MCCPIFFIISISCSKSASSDSVAPSDNSTANNCTQQPRNQFARCCQKKLRLWKKCGQLQSQGRSSRILIGPADFPPPMGEVWFLGLGAKLEARRAEAWGQKGRERGWVFRKGATSPLPTSERVWGSAVSSPSGVRKRILDVEDPIKRINVGPMLCCNIGPTAARPAEPAATALNPAVKQQSWYKSTLHTATEGDRTVSGHKKRTKTDRH